MAKKSKISAISGVAGYLPVLSKHASYLILMMCDELSEHQFTGTFLI